MVKRNRFCLRCSSVYRETLQKPVQLLRATFGNDISDVVLQTAINNELAVRHVTDRKINPGPPAQRFMKPPLSRYIALARRRTNGAYVASRAIIGKAHMAIYAPGARWAIDGSTRRAPPLA